MCAGQSGWLVFGLLSVIALVVYSADGEAQTKPKRMAVPFTQVKLTDSFWKPRQEINRTVTLPHVFQQSENTGRIANFEKAGGLIEGEFEGLYFNDSDVYKLLEGAAYILATHPDPSLDTKIDELIAKIAAAQQPDGYLNTYFTLVEPDKRWTDLPVRHELYCAGHLFEAAVAHYQATGKRNLLEVAIRFADHIDRVFGEEALIGVPGHEEIELALVKLAELTGENRYFRLAQFFIDHRGYGNREYCQDHLPVREQSELTGHAVRAMYLYSAMADIAIRTGDTGLVAALDRLWEDLTLRRMYITGGVGPSAHNEGFTTAYDLPNDSAYAETCAAIGLVLWSQRMFLLHGHAQYIDVLERALYNGMLAGVAITGERFFYVNPLASRGRHHRQPWFNCACCPPNVLRLIPQVGSFAYAISDDTLYVNLYMANEADLMIGGEKVRLVEETTYPWAGEIKLTVTPEEATPFELKLRVPEWSRTTKVRLKGEKMAIEPAEDGYISIRRTWWPGDTVELKLDMRVRRMAAHPNVKADTGRVALMRGPLVYCLEGVDHEGSVRDIALPRKADLKAEFVPDLLNGVVVLRGKGLRHNADWTQGLYREVGDEPQVHITAIPYYAWDHREPGEMVVWIPEITALAEGKLPPTIANKAAISASHSHEPQALTAVNDRLLPLASGDQQMPRFTWWDHKGTREWIKYGFAEPQRIACVEVYWFDDTGAGECRVPASWEVEYFDGREWRSVEGTSQYRTAKDQFNRVAFEAVETTGIQLLVQLQEGFSGGILEWRVPECE
ncbi:MAG: glycoside hydrolase family 127 protein [Candidatus Zipacnadales bacterium]